MATIQTRLKAEMISEDVTDIDTSNVPSRLEMIQKRRLAIMEKIESKEDFYMDETQAIMWRSLVDSFEKQELYKHKSAQDKEENDKDRAAYAQAQETARILREQRRDEIAKGDLIPDNAPPPPAFQKEMLEKFGVDEIAIKTDKYSQQEWVDFHKEVIRNGGDPRHTLDENGNIVKVRDE